MLIDTLEIEGEKEREKGKKRKLKENIQYILRTSFGLSVSFGLSLSIPYDLYKNNVYRCISTKKKKKKQTNTS